MFVSSQPAGQWCSLSSTKSRRNLSRTCSQNRTFSKRHSARSSGLNATKCRVHFTASSGWRTRYDFEPVRSLTVWRIVVPLFELLYRSIALVHVQVNHDWNLTETIDTRLIDVFLPVSKTDEFCIKNEILCIKTEEFCINKE